MDQDNRKLSTVIIEALRSKGLTVDRLATMTGISERFLSSLVNDRLEKLPAAPYVHGYLIKIAEMLGLDGQKLWQEYLKHNAAIRRSGRSDKLPENRFVVPRPNKTILITSLAGLLVLIYALIRLPTFFGKPKLLLKSLGEEVVYVKEPSFTIQGSVSPKDRLTINSEQTYPDKDGNFEKTLELQPGFNTFTFKAKRFLGKELIVTRQIFYETATTTPQVLPQAEETKNQLPSQQ